ncbi:hypothetical protein BaRGS_00031746 [Batillaria attramentaria]|uniref:Uncharacterized protein n=1 Tax=Batillaria attramentaria TaxID=370345 RepID=A0ABD0JPT5_9CAEN
MARLLGLGKSRHEQNVTENSSDKTRTGAKGEAFQACKNKAGALSDRRLVSRKEELQAQHLPVEEINTGGWERERQRSVCKPFSKNAQENFSASTSRLQTGTISRASTVRLPERQPAHLAYFSIALKGAPLSPRKPDPTAQRQVMQLASAAATD